ncbi:MAG: endonuclease III [Planctomycetes bacterium]|nr:endonuclease III [Planctomycetota bacterium]
MPDAAPQPEIPFALPRKSPKQRERANALLADLDRRYPEAHCRLDWTRPHELLVATILSAQATDEGVNAATPALFRRFPAPADYARATPDDIAPHIRTIGLWRNKARAVHESMAALVERHAGEVPRDMESLLALRGVARKTANVVLGNCFGIQAGVVVDTHVGRLALRMGLTRHEDPGKAERDLMALFPRERWSDLSHLLIFHGRAVCRARGNSCATDAICGRYCREAVTRRRRGP